MPGRVCIDASLAIKWVIGEEFTPSAISIRREWVAEERELIAPPVFRPEVTAAIRLAVSRGSVPLDSARRALERALNWQVVIAEDSAELQRHAFEIATAFEHPRAYDAQYLALAQFEDCDFWTGDRRLINSLQGRLSWAHWIGDYQPA